MTFISQTSESISGQSNQSCHHYQPSSAPNASKSTGLLKHPPNHPMKQSFSCDTSLGTSSPYNDSNSYTTDSCIENVNSFNRCSNSKNNNTSSKSNSNSNARNSISRFNHVIRNNNGNSNINGNGSGSNPNARNGYNPSKPKSRPTSSIMLTLEESDNEFDDRLFAKNGQPNNNTGTKSNNKNSNNSETNNDDDVKRGGDNNNTEKNKNVLSARYLPAKNTSASKKRYSVMYDSATIASYLAEEARKANVGSDRSVNISSNGNDSDNSNKSGSRHDNVSNSDDICGNSLRNQSSGNVNDLNTLSSSNVLINNVDQNAAPPSPNPFASSSSSFVSNSSLLDTLSNTAFKKSYTNSKSSRYSLPNTLKPSSFYSQPSFSSPILSSSPASSLSSFSTPSASTLSPPSISSSTSTPLSASNTSTPPSASTLTPPPSSQQRLPPRLDPARASKRASWHFGSRNPLNGILEDDDVELMLKNISTSASVSTESLPLSPYLQPPSLQPPQFSSSSLLPPSLLSPTVNIYSGEDYMNQPLAPPLPRHHNSPNRSNSLNSYTGRPLHRSSMSVGSLHSMTGFYQNPRANKSNSCIIPTPQTFYNHPSNSFSSVHSSASGNSVTPVNQYNDTQFPPVNNSNRPFSPVRGSSRPVSPAAGVGLGIRIGNTAVGAPGLSVPSTPTQQRSSSPSLTQHQPFNFRSTAIPLLNQSGTTHYRRGHKYKHSSVSMNFFKEDVRMPLTIPASLPIPLFSEWHQSMTRDQTIRVCWSIFHFFVAFLVYTITSPYSTLSALAHLLFYDAMGALLCAVVDILGNFDVWQRSSVHLPFGLQRAEVLAGYALAILLIFMGADIMSHSIQDMAQAAYLGDFKLVSHSHGVSFGVSAYLAADATTGNGHTHSDSHGHGSEPDDVDWNVIIFRVLLSIFVTTVSAVGFDNHTRIAHALRNSSSTTNTNNAKTASSSSSSPVTFLNSLPNFLSNPSHFITIFFSVSILFYPLEPVLVRKIGDTLLTPLLAASMCFVGWQLAKSLGGMLVMSFPGENRVAEVMEEVAKLEYVESVGQIAVWQVHHCVWLACLKIKVRGGGSGGSLYDDESVVRMEAARLVKDIMSKGFEEKRKQNGLADGGNGDAGLNEAGFYNTDTFFRQSQTQQILPLSANRIGHSKRNSVSAFAKDSFAKLKAGGTIDVESIRWEVTIDITRNKN